MRIAFLCKRRYMGKDVILDRYARLYEIPRQLACLGHELRVFCLDYHGHDDGGWVHEAAPGLLHLQSCSLGRLKLPALMRYPWRLLRLLRDFRPDILIGASDIPHAALARWVALRLQRPYALDLYDNFEGFGQARIPGFVPALRRAVREAAIVTTTSEPLRRKVLEDGAQGAVIAMPSSVDLTVFHPGDKAQARQALGLPAEAKLIGTAGGLYREKGIAPLYDAWQRIAGERPDVHLVLAGPLEAALPLPQGPRVHYLGALPHAKIAELFGALDVGVISVLDTSFGRYCFPQKAYEMLACGLAVVAADVGALSNLFLNTPQLLFRSNDADSLANAVLSQLQRPTAVDLPIPDWHELITSMETSLARVAGRR
jgi:glycosyltransferase involved in cell wall biosynthesis